MSKFHFTITGVFETDSTTLALLQLSQIAEVTKVNINETFKLDFTNINVWKDQAYQQAPPYHQHFDAIPNQPFQQHSPFDPLPSQVLDDLDTVETMSTKPVTVVPQPWKDKLAGEGMPTD